MDFGLLPPEINSARIYTGPGSAPMLAAAAAWDSLAAELHSAAAAHSSAITQLGSTWRGPASSAMSTAAAPYVAWMTATATQAEETAVQAKAAAGAFETARAMTVPPPVIAANRATLMALVATNVLGQNTPAIATTEAHYLEMWAQDAAAMYSYAATSATASALAPFTGPQSTTNPGALAAQHAAVGHAAGTAAGGRATQQVLAAVPGTLQGLAQPGAGGAAGMSTVTGVGSSMASSMAYAPFSAVSGLTGASGKGAVKGVGKSAEAGMSALPALAGVKNLGLLEDTVGLGMDGVGLAGLDGGGVGLDLIGVGLDFAGADSLFQSEGLGPLAGLGGLGPLVPGVGGAGIAGGAGMSASMGQAASLGAMSVPQGWAAAPALNAGGLAPFAGSGWSAAPAASAGGAAMPRMSVPTFGERGIGGAAAKLGYRPPMVLHSPVAG